MSTDQGLAAIPARHYTFLVLMTALNVMNFVDRQLLASFANFIVPELGLTDTQFGLLTGLVFIVFYAVMGLFMGALADMLHRPRLVAFGVALWSVLTAASGAARGFVSMAIPRMLIGVGESILTPTAMSMLADRFPKSQLGFAAGFYYMGVPIGVGLSLLIAGYLGPAIGWRNCFYLLGAIGLVFAVVMLFVKETPRQHHGETQTAPLKLNRESLVQIFNTLTQALRKSPALGLTMAGGVTLHFILGAAAFEQLWFVQERGFDKAEIAQMSGWIAMVAGIMGNLFGGLGGDYWQQRTGTGRPQFLFWVMLVSMPFSIAYRLVDPSSFFFYFGIFVGFFQLGAFYGPTFSTVQELVPPQIRSTVVAFYILMLNLIGLGFGITAGGIVIDTLRTAGFEQPYTWTLLSFTLLSGLAIPMFYLAGQRFTEDQKRLYASDPKLAE